MNPFLSERIFLSGNLWNHRQAKIARFRTALNSKQEIAFGKWYSCRCFTGKYIRALSITAATPLSSSLAPGAAVCQSITSEALDPDVRQ